MRLLSIGITVLFIFIFSSCKKNVDDVVPPVKFDSAIIFGFKDSTLLIKCISRGFYDAASGTTTDPQTTYLFYDTLNKKIILTIEPILSSSQPYSGAEYNYNNSGLLTKIVYKNITGAQEDADYSSIDYSYDAQNVLKSLTLTLISGQSFQINFNKTISSAGYELNWLDNLPDNPYETQIYRANFDNNGKFISSYEYNDQYIVGDSAVYDANGNIAKIIFHQSYTNNPDYPKSYTRYDFISRDTKGDQLYNLLQIMYNGIANFPRFFDRPAFSTILGDEKYQFIKYPATKTTASFYDEVEKKFTNTTFDATPQYDSKNRLTKYANFFDDGILIPFSYTITYYK